MNGNTDKIIIKEYSKEDKNSIINLLGYLLHGSNERERIELFNWRYEENPYKKKDLIFLAYSGSVLVGFRAYLVQYFFILDKKLTVISPADTIVHPDYRRRGIISMLNKQSLDLINSEYPSDSILLNTTTSKNAMPTYLKYKWQPCSNKNKVYGYRFSILNILKSLLKKDSKAEKAHNISFSKAGFVFEVSRQINNSKIIDFVSINRDKSKFTNIRDASFYDWRYSYESDKYLLILCYLNKTVVGYVILKELSNYEHSVEEFLAVDSKVLRLMFKTIQRKLEIPILRTIIFADEDNKRMKSCGFFIESKLYLKIFKRRRFPVLVRPTKPNISDVDFFVEGFDIRDIENWQLYQSDRH